MFTAIISLLSASFALAEALLLRLIVIIVVIIIIVVVLTTQRSKKKKMEGNMFCQKCGCGIPAGAKVCPRCGKIAEEMLFCQRCGEEITSRTVFCPRCGSPVGQGASFPQSQQKSKIAAGLFGIFLGALGIHNFYLGYKGKAIGQLLLSILSFGLLAWVSALWGLIEGIMILAGSICYDANGIPLRD